MPPSQGFQTHMLPSREVSAGFAEFSPLSNLWSAVPPKGYAPRLVEPASFPLAIGEARGYCN